MRRAALLTLTISVLAACPGVLASDPAAAKKRPPETPRATPEYEYCPDGTWIEKGQFCPIPPPPPRPELPPSPLRPPPALGEWRSNWGAVAVGSESAILGSVTGFTQAVRAEDAALADCRAKGGSACTFGYSYKDGCFVMVQGDRTYFFEKAESAPEAAKTGLDRCRSGQTGCRIRLSACALPTFMRY
jgi:hypothetical protein